MAEALAGVKRCFGPDAIILSTRTVSRGGVLGLKSKPLVEITAARETPALAEAGRTRRLAASQARHTTGRALAAPGITKVAAVQLGDAASSTSLLKEFVSLKSLVSDLVLETRRTNTEKAPKTLYALYRNLIENAVADEVALSLIRRLEDELTPEQLKDAGKIREHLSRALVESLPVSGPIMPARMGEPYIAALIGPTGVGKTTTIAKLAANFSLRERKKVGLITLDTYRIAAVEQLKTYAQIIDVPLKVAMSPGEYQDAVIAMSDRDVILVDSAGRSQRDAIKIQELKGFFAVAAPHETHLVLSSASNERVISQAIDRFSDIGFDRVIFTKMDEAVGFGVILGALQKVKAKLSYFTTGQDVPSDIEVGEPNSLADMILGPCPTGQNEGTGKTEPRP
jgi:flagellar biosynthesis protein FlhF